MFRRLLSRDRITPDALHRRIQEHQPVTIIDVNSHESWSQAHVPGAAHLDPTVYAPSELPADKDTALVFYCSNMMCRKAPNAAGRARKMGYRNVQVMSTGIRGWLAAELPTEAGRGTT